jgi:hypothetical protein
MNKEAFRAKVAMAAAEELGRFHSAQPEDMDQDTVSIVEQILLAYTGALIKRTIQYIFEEQEEEDVLPFNEGG